MINKFTSLFLILPLLLISSLLYGQRNGVVLDIHSNEPLAFVSIIFNDTPTLGTFTDIDGRYQVPDSILIEKIQFSYIGYDDLRIDGSASLAVKMKPSSVLISEVVVRPGENPANSIIRFVIKNKKRNDPRFISAYQYTSYNKVTYDLVMKDTLSKAALQMKKLFQGGPMFLMESITERKFMRPEISEETVLATKVSGFKHPTFATLATDIQPFAFYQDLITVYDVHYLNPISNGSLKRYEFKIEDTIFHQVDTTFVLSFHPSKGRHFDGLKGLLYINTNGYAVQNVIASPAEKGLVDIKIQQEYELINNTQWFPKKLNFEMYVVPKGMKNEDGENAKIYVEGRSYFSNINLSPSFRKKDLSVSSFILHEDSDKRSMDYWNQYRVDSLKVEEKISYRVVDSIGQLLKLDAIVQLTEKLSVNKIGMGVFDLDILECLVYNKYEQTRLGIGLHTNEKLWKHISVGGFGGYGWADKKWKYGGDIIWTISKKHEVELQAKYQDNLRETGRSRLNIFDRNKYDLRALVAFQMDRIQQSRLAFGFRAFRFAKFKLTLNKTDVSPRYRYAYRADNQIDSLNYSNTSFSFDFRYAFAEKFYQTKTDRISQGTKYPILVMSYTKGLKDVLGGELDYKKVEASLSESIFIRNWGRLNIRVEGGILDKPLPFGLLFSGDGSKGKSKVSVMIPNYFQTATTQEFLSDQYVNIFFSQNFGSLFSIKKFSPHFIIHHNMGWGRLAHPENHEKVNFSVRDKGLYEAGLQIDNILKINILNTAYIGLGGGVYYRYGAYAFEQPIDNFAFKVSFRYSTK